MSSAPPEKFALGPDGARVLSEKWREWRDIQFRKACNDKEAEEQQQQHQQRKLNSGVLPSTKAQFASQAVRQERLVEQQQQREIIITWQPSANEDTALAFCSNSADVHKMGEGSSLSNSAAATESIFSDPEVRQELGLRGDISQALSGLNELFDKYDVPAGLANRLLAVSDVELMDFIIDDSASMAKDSNVKNKVTGKNISRWQEVKVRLQQMLQLLAYVPGLPPIDFVFLNSSRSFTLRRVIGESPALFLRGALGKIDDIFDVIVRPSGNSPIRRAIWASLQRGKGHSVARYLFCDGEDDDGDVGHRGITQMLMKRKDPRANPFTFLSCSDDECTWMKDAEEAAEYCAELDDYADESREVLRSQGQAFPYTFGMHLICQLVAAISPDDLDALDESAPMTANTLSDTLGHRLTDQEYSYYWREFLRAQRSGDLKTDLDRFKRNFALNSWPMYERQFATVQGPARLLPVVQQFKEAVKLLKAQECK